MDGGDLYRTADGEGVRAPSTPRSRTAPRRGRRRCGSARTWRLFWRCAPAACRCRHTRRWNRSPWLSRNSLHTPASCFMDAARPATSEGLWRSLWVYRLVIPAMLVPCMPGAAPVRITLQLQEHGLQPPLYPHAVLAQRRCRRGVLPSAVHGTPAAQALHGAWCNGTRALQHREVPGHCHCPGAVD